MDQQNVNHGRDQNIINQPEVVIVIPPPKQRREGPQSILLGFVKSEVDSRIEQSLHLELGKERINLGKEMQPEWVQSPWDRNSKQRPAQPLPAETTIWQVFRQQVSERSSVKPKLLILGEPGSGKTTTMVELARELVELAEQEVDQPIPVLLNLSSWNDPKQSILDWLVAELNSKYGVKQESSKTWLAQKQLLPLLDGLDEVDTTHQKDCAVALNQWLKNDSPIGLVVSCRREEYKDNVQQKLYLDGAVLLKPLSETQIEQYLDQFGLTTVWETAHSSETLQDLLSKPLFLSIFGLVAATGNFDATAWQRRTTNADQQEYLFDQYWIVAMGRELVDNQEQDQGILSRTYGRRGLPHQKRVRRALVFAAKALEHESQTELLIEKMQPSWLPSKSQQWMYRLTFGLMGGLIYGLTFGLINGLTFGLISGLFFWLFFGLMNWQIDKNDKRSFNIQVSTIHEARRLRIFGLMLGLLGGLMLGLLGGLILGLFFVLPGAIVSIKNPISPNEGIKNCLRNTLILIAIASLMVVTLKLLPEKTLRSSFSLNFPADSILHTLLLTLLFMGFLGGAWRQLFQHIALRIVLLLNSYAPFRYDRLLDYCTERLLLQRIGGRYRFMHKLLQEHFAKMELGRVIN